MLKYDSNTGISWLDLTATVGQRYNAVLSGYGGFTTNLGFRFATVDKLAQLRTDAGITGVRNTAGDISNINNTRTLINLLSVISNNGHSLGGFGYIADANPPGAGNHVVADFAVNDIGEYDTFIGRYDANNSFNTFFSFLTDPSWQQTNQGVIGNFLVMAPVPIPSTIWLFGSGLVGLLGRRTKIKKQPDAQVNIPPHKTAVVSNAGDTQRDRHIQTIAQNGRIAWQWKTDYNLRNYVECAMQRYKRIFGTP